MNQIYKTTSLTNKEHFFKEEDFIISKTDLTGRITYCNRGFMRIVGISYKKLIGEKHNIIRHPDMPKTAFRMLWKALGADEEWFGFVKNISIDGGFYWVFANVTADKQGDEKIGYYSVRRPAPRGAISVIEALYAELNRIESEQGVDAATKHLETMLTEQGITYRDFVMNLYFEHSSEGLA